MNSEEILNKVDEIIKDEIGEDVNKLTSIEQLEKFILPGLENSKNTLSSLYKFEVKDYPGFFGKIKNKIISKIKNITLNVVERESMRQQKFNELAFKAIQILVEENKKKSS